MPKTKQSKLVRMPRPLNLLITEAVKGCGSYEPDEVMLRIEEYMTGKEYEQTAAFLTWLTKHKLTFGSGNADLRWTEFMQQR